VSSFPFTVLGCICTAISEAPELQPLPVGVAVKTVTPSPTLTSESVEPDNQAALTEPDSFHSLRDEIETSVDQGSHSETDEAPHYQG